MCVDDIVCQGAEPLFFLDYIAVGQLDPDHIEQLVEGVAEGCRHAGCALVGGEMAEHPGAMEPGEFDLVGFAVGVVERDRLITGERVRPGDVVIGLPSPGLRSNGYSLARRVLLDRAGRSLDEPACPGAHHNLADELLQPSVIYAPAVLALAERVDVRAVAHITGGGLPGNVPRVLPADCDAVIDRTAWEVPRIFGEIQRLGESPTRRWRVCSTSGSGWSWWSLPMTRSGPSTGCGTTATKPRKSDRSFPARGWCTWAGAARQSGGRGEGPDRRRRAGHLADAAGQPGGGGLPDGAGGRR